MNIFQRNARKLVIVAVIAGSASVIFIRLIEAGTLVIGFYRLTFSVLMFAVPVALGGYKGFKTFTARDYLICALGGLLLSCHFFTWFTAVKNTAIASAAVLMSLHPLVVLFTTTVFMKQRVSLKAVCGILAALIGCAIIAGLDYRMAWSFFGNAMAFMSGVFFGLYLLTGRTVRVRIPTLNYVFIVFGACWAFFTIAMFVTKTPFTGYRIQDYLWILAMAAVCQLLAHALYNWCVGYASSLYVSAWASIDSVFSIALGALIFREFPTEWQCIGGVIAISGLLFYNYYSGEKTEGKNDVQSKDRRL